MITEHLERTVKTVEDVFYEWDGKHRGKISMGEFRVNVRALGFTNDHSAVDELFHSFDIDGSNYLDINALKAMFRSLVREASDFKIARQRQCEFAASLRDVARLYATAAEATAAAENAQQNLQAIQATPPMEALVGLKLCQRNTKLADLLRACDKNGDGERRTQSSSPTVS